MTVFAMFMLIFAPLATDDYGRFPWQDGWTGGKSSPPLGIDLIAIRYRDCQKETALWGWGPISKDKARECFLEKYGHEYEDDFDHWTVSKIRNYRPSSTFYSDETIEDIQDILIYLGRSEIEILLEEKKEELALSRAANETEKVSKCPDKVDLQSYPDVLEVTDFTDRNYGGVYELDGTYNCNPKWTNLTCGKHRDGTRIQCNLFLSPEKIASKSGTWVVLPLPPSEEWEAGAFYQCPGMPWESCLPGWIGDISVTAKE